MKILISVFFALLILPQIIYAQEEETGSQQDTTSPYIEQTAPGDVLPANTTSVVVSVSTDENSTCKYSTTEGVLFESMTSAFSTTGGIDHSVTINNLVSGNSYDYYVRCIDTALNVNEDDYIVSFSIEDPASPVDTTDHTNNNTNNTNNQPPIYTPPPYTPPASYTPAPATYVPPPAIIPQTFDNPAINAQYVNYVNSVYTPPKPPVTTTKPVVKRIVPPTRLSSNLKLNSKGLEVLLLNKTLNLLGHTVATTGQNSIGKETSNFDIKTKEALIDYQNNYAEAGLIPSGILDNATIIILNSDINKLVTEAESLATTTVQSNNKNKILLNISRYFDSLMDRLTDFIIQITK